jgi:hypothetical protein
LRKAGVVPLKLAGGEGENEVDELAGLGVNNGLAGV